MPELLRIEEPAEPATGSPALAAFLEFAFRPLYLGAAAWAAVSIAIWIFQPPVWFIVTEQLPADLARTASVLITRSGARV